MADISNEQVDYEVSHDGKVTIVAIRGRLSALHASRIQAALSALPKHGQVYIVLDLSKLTWIDSSGVGALVSLYKLAKAQNGDVKVIGLQRQPKEIFRLLRLEVAFEVCETVEQAISLMNFG